MADSKTNAKQSFDAYSLIIGFSGSLGSGCTFLSEGIAQTLGTAAHYFKVSDYLRKEAKTRGLPDTVDALQTLGDELRSTTKQLSILVEKCLERVREEDEEKGFSQDDDTVILIDGIKNEGEVKYLRQFANFYLVSVHAERHQRRSRLINGEAATSRFKTVEEFQDADRRDEEEDIPHGQQIKKCNYLADIIIDNDKEFAQHQETDKTKFFQAFLNDYIYPMRKARKGERAHDRPPKVDETLITMAYCASKRSSCLKRKVGAVIAFIRSVDDVYPDANRDRIERDMPFQVVSVGYNDVPWGTPCVFSDWQKCYRDHLQETHAQLLKHCWSCGHMIPDKLVCPHCKTSEQPRAIKCSNCEADLLADYECSECKSRVFSVCLPGREATPGNLLDMCRALHAEENAILGLSGVGKMGKGELVLYTTTFPCNLCANKIIAAGIKKVYYAEPYTMKESRELLEKCKVEVVKFQGIKSSAFFRLYS
ncbi:hypothetical protein ACFL6U_09840 [Planctomycetota bacterium]